MSEFVNVKEARQLLMGICRPKFDQLRKHENFPKPYRIGDRGKLSFNRSEIIEFRETELREGA